MYLLTLCRTAQWAQFQELGSGVEEPLQRALSGRARRDNSQRAVRSEPTRLAARLELRDANNRAFLATALCPI